MARQRGDVHGDSVFRRKHDYAAAQSQPVTFTISKATPTVTVTDTGRVYNGSPYAVTNAYVTGVPSDGTIASFGDSSLSYTYYTEPANTAITGAPTNAGTYAVVATFAGNSNYAAASSAPADFTISKATPTVSVSDVGGTYNGSSFAATATVAGVDGIPGNSLEDVSSTLLYYAGSDTSGTGSASVPVTRGDAHGSSVFRRKQRTTQRHRANQ